MDKTIKIFVASSEELKEERRMLAELANSLNTKLEKLGIHVIMEEWENLDASMGVKHKQEEYNDKLRECDMCLVLYWTKFGMYTEMELETAVQQMNAGKNPHKIYVYFKNSDNITPELKEFRDSFPTKYGHFYSPFSNSDTLKAHFLLQFMEYQSKFLQKQKIAEVKDGRVYVDGVEYVDLKNVPFAGNNEDYNSLVNDIKELELDLADMNPSTVRYLQKAEIYQQKKERLAKMESSLWDTAFLITKLCTSKCSERLERAMTLFNAGDNKGALAILNEDEIDKEIKNAKYLIDLGKEGHKKLINCLKQYCLRIQTLKNEDINTIQIIELYKKTIEVARGHVDLEWYKNFLLEFIDYCMTKSLYSQANLYCEECLKMLWYDVGNSKFEFLGNNIADYFRMIANVFRITQNLNRAGEVYSEAIEIFTKTSDSKGLCSCLEDSSWFYLEQGNLENVEHNLKKVLKIRKFIYKDENSIENAMSYARSLLLFGNFLREQGQYNEALSHLKEASRIITPISDKFPNDIESKRNLQASTSYMALILHDLHEWKSAVEYSEQSLSLARKMYKEYPKTYIEDLANELLNAGALQCNIGRYICALKYTNEAISLYKYLEKNNPGVYSEDINLLIKNKHIIESNNEITKKVKQ